MRIVMYSLAKEGVEMLTRVLALELVHEHISLNVIVPCVVRIKFSRM